jgi:hypothetical protein
MSLLVNTVQPCPGQYYFAAAGTGGGGGGGGNVGTTTAFTIDPVKGPAGGALDPAITISDPSGTSWEIGLSGNATGSPVNTGNNLTFEGYGDNGVSTGLPVIIQRSTGSVIAQNLQIQDYVFTTAATPQVIQGAIAAGQSIFSLPGGFTPLDTGLYVVELEGVIVLGGNQFLASPSFFVNVGLTGGPVGTGGSINLKPWPQPVNLAPNAGQGYLTVASNTFLLTTGNTYGITFTLNNPTNAGAPPNAQPLAGFYLADGVTPASTTPIDGRLELGVNIISLCRVNMAYQ